MLRLVTEAEKLVEEQYKKRAVCKDLKEHLKNIVNKYLQAHPEYGMGFYEVIQGVAQDVGKSEWKKEHQKFMVQMQKDGGQSPKSK